MFNDERENRYDAEQGYSTRNGYARYDYDMGYEEDRRRTSISYRDSLESSLERPASRSRLERADQDRYDYYRSTSPSENNYDRFFDSKNRQSEKRSAKRRTSLIVAYVAVALVAIIAVTMAVIGISDKEVVETKPLTVESLTASAENVGGVSEVSAAEETVPEEPVLGGENYILLKNGEIVKIDVPEQPEVQQEEEKGFDKLCSWLNGVFGG